MLTENSFVLSFVEISSGILKPIFMSHFKKIVACHKLEAELGSNVNIRIDVSPKIKYKKE